jgi:hypothetical protein
MRVALTGRYRIGHLRNSPELMRRMTVANLCTPLETLPRHGTEIEGGPFRPDPNIQGGPV